MNKYNPKDYQEIAIENAIYSKEGLLNKERTQLIMACGTGKTLVGMWICEEYYKCLDKVGTITVLLFPSLYLVNQTRETYKEQSRLFNIIRDSLVVCSDTQIVSDDEIFELDTSEVSYPVTTELKDIEKYLTSRAACKFHHHKLVNL